MKKYKYYIKIKTKTKIEISSKLDVKTEKPNCISN